MRYERLPTLSSEAAPKLSVCEAVISPSDPFGVWPPCNRLSPASHGDAIVASLATLQQTAQHPGRLFVLRNPLRREIRHPHISLCLGLHPVQGGTQCGGVIG